MIVGEGEAKRQAVDLFRRLRLPDPEQYRAALSPSGLRRPAAAGDDRHGHVLPARSDHLRRADHRARRDDPDRGAGRHQAGRAPIQHRRDLHLPRSRRGGPDGRSRHGAALWRAGGGGDHPPDAERSPEALYQIPVGGARAAQAGGRPARTSCSGSSTSTPAMASSRCCTTSRSRSPAGRTVAVVGESGSGKSTLARVITGLLPPTTGHVLLRRQAPAAGAEASRARTSLRRIQMIYQMPDTALNPRRRMRDIIGRPLELLSRPFWRHAREADPRIAANDRARSERFIDRLPGELSAARSSASASRARWPSIRELIICDEVTSALDQIVAEEILKLLAATAEGTRHLLPVTSPTISRPCARSPMRSWSCIRAGSWRAAAQSQVLTPPHHAYTELLLSSVPEMDPGLARRHSQEARKRLGLGVRAFAARASAARASSGRACCD